ncbi:MAG: hypothetical protein HYY23_22580 [Verrucomicrobia bacterium]|nr:hypothetical protein [Verrucomicrobiota bacterium]
MLPPSASAAITAPPTRRAQNFLVQDLRGTARGSASLKSELGRPLVQLDLDVLALSADRIKQSVCRELDVSARAWGRIHLCLVPAAGVDQEIHILATRFADGWHYRVNVPDQIEDLKLVRGLVEVLLLELANRRGGPKSAEIPLWLTEGLSSQIGNTLGPDLVLQSLPSGWMLQSARNVGGWQDAGGLDKLRQARSVLRHAAPASFAELGHPPLDTLQGGSSPTRFQSSSQLFVAELGHLPNGRACLVNMLQELPSCWNWETAFLRAFRPYFTRLLDVEKWWTVVVTSFTGRDPGQVWAAEICFEKLDEILLQPAHVRLTAEVMPVRTYVTPQQIIADWDVASQKVALERALGQLALLRVHCPLDVASLIERYRAIFVNYLQKRAEANSFSSSKGQATISIPLLLRETIDRLDELYRQREALRRAYAVAAEATAAATPKPQ